ncbi:hypothetical protein HH110_04610 [Stenotrophomonas sp. SAM-B]|uniref:hypothetical protein n=1 Tax=Stenotrophomonas sp. SAM-B TaxID=2729141 RepID=UPI0015A1AD16|nr:hypothetical protein [Stenotrophomonas sp. SAM-B]NWF32328.1 hypothetical protein [Stenotrophomonas sp. SAM-B]
MPKTLLASLAAALLLTACSAGPSANKAEDAMLVFVKANGSDDARLTKFTVGKCEKGDGGYNCPVQARVPAINGRFDEDFNGVFTFAEVGGAWKVIGVVSRTL